MYLTKQIIYSLVILHNLVWTLNAQKIENDYYTRNRDTDIIESFSQGVVNSDESHVSDGDDEKLNNEDIVSLLEERYRFMNDNTSTRYQIRKDDRVYPGNIIIR